MHFKVNIKQEQHAPFMGGAEEIALIHGDDDIGDANNVVIEENYPPGTT